jgi:hypothetical protein
MDIIRSSLVGLTVSAIACCAPPVTPRAVSDKQALSKNLAFELSVGKEEFSSDEAIEVDMTLINLTDQPITVRRESLTAHVKYEYVDSSKLGPKHVGNIAAEDFPGKSEGRGVVLTSHGTLEEHVELRILFPRLLSRPGSYSLTFEYCEYEVATRCVESNAIEIRINEASNGGRDAPQSP